MSVSSIAKTLIVALSHSPWQVHKSKDESVRVKKNGGLM